MQLVEPRPSRPIPIRMTPLIDVVFILLVFFMLTSRLLPVGSLELANATPDQRTEAGEPIPELTVGNDGRVLWEGKGQSFELNELIPALAAEEISEVTLGTHPQTILGQFTQALTRLDAAGIETHWQRQSEQTP
ncbi:ExbD/TolR family protein [Marinobacter similis]|uniref:Ferric siderophore transporter innermembrane protein E n=1 Tax=Marinobacter similis TaxID=1420916 RepID=W5YPX9_9GAMM|nr:biopolymer transporter ExbD [Marinobacter similis]AHI28523.1 ferric siderophore transporter innermembrane protein E [Marinobacter similis]